MVHLVMDELGQILYVYFLCFILSLFSEIDAFIFRPHGRPTKDGKEPDPSLGLIISNSTFVVIPFIVVLTFLQTPMGSISP